MEPSSFSGNQCDLKIPCKAGLGRSILSLTLPSGFVRLCIPVIALLSSLNFYLMGSVLSSLSVLPSLTISKAHAQSPLDEILMRPKNRWLSDRQIVFIPKRPKHIDPDSSYWSIFESEDSPKMMAGWLGSPTGEFIHVGSSGKLKPHLAVATMAYGLQHARRADFFIRVMVPFPETSSIEGIKLIPALNKFQPPYLAVNAIKQTEIWGLPGRIFYEEDNECSIHLPIARDGVIFASTGRCKDVSHLERLLSSLNINRLQQKLLS